MKHFNRKIPLASEKFNLPVEVDGCRLESFTLTETAVRMIHIRSAIGNGSRWDGMIKPNHPYTKLTENGTVWMSDTPMEVESSRGFWSQAHGRVFVAGLGIGVTLLPLLEDESVTEILVAEKDKRMLMIWQESTKDLNTNKVQVLHADATEPELFLEKGEKFDAIWIDIWPNICSDYWEEMKVLKAKYRKYLNKENPDRFLACWMEDTVRRLHREDRRSIW